MKPFRFISGLLLVAAVYGVGMAQTAATTKTDDGPVLLQYHFHANDVRNLKYMMEQKIHQEIQGQEMTINQTFGFGYRINVLSVDEKGNASTKLTYRSIRVKMDNPAGSIDYDSTKPDATPAPGTETFAALLDQSLNIKFAPDGQVLQIDGIDAMLKRMMDKQKNLTDDSRATMEKTLKNQFGDRALKEMFEQMTRIYPDKAVKVGDSWSRHAELEKGVSMIMDNTYTLTGRNKGVSSVTVKTICKPNPKGAPMEIGELTISYELNGTMNGKMEIDEASGWPRSAKMTQSLTGNMHLEGAALPQAMTVPVTIDSTITATTE